jgi:hypothetical protein
MIVSKSLSRIIAKISGDGHLNKRYIRYSNKCKLLRDEFVADIHREFRKVHIIKGVVNSGTPFVQIQDKKLNKYLQKFHPNYKSKNLIVPKQIRDSRLSIQVEYLRALFDDDGTVGIRVYEKTKEWKRDIKIDSKSKALLRDIKELLKKGFKIETNKIGSCQKEDKVWHYLIITGKENLIKFQKSIDFKHPIKKKKLKILIDSYGKTFRRDNEGFKEINDSLRSLKV